MDQQLKQRLVGVAVIFLLAIIFVPMLLDGAGTRPQHVQVEIPPQPQIEPFEVVEQKVIELKKQAQQIPDVPPRIVDEISDPPTPAETKPKENSPEKTKKPASVVVAKKPVEAKPATSQKTVASAPKPAAQPKPKTLAPAPQPAKAAPKPVVAASKKKVGGETWIIQAGSFNDKDKAYKLRNKLRKSRLASDVFIEKFPHGGKISYRVRLGMFFSRNKAKIVANKLRAKYNIKGLVQQYDK